MKRLLIMSFTLFFVAVAGFAQTTISGAAKKPAKVKNMRVEATRPSRPSVSDGEVKTLPSLVDKPAGSGSKTVVTRPSRPSVSDGEVKTLPSLVDKPAGSGSKTVVTRPSRPSVSDGEVKTLPSLVDKPTGRAYDKTKVVRPK